MGTVFKKTFTKPLPAGAELFTREGQQFARWKSTKGKTRKALVTASDNGQARIIVESHTYFAKFRDGGRIVRTVATGCRDEQAARSVLGEFERRAELVKAGVMTAGEDAIADHQGTALAAHFDAYGEHLKAKGVTRIHREDMVRYLNRVAADCSFVNLADLDRAALERWLCCQADKSMSARTRNAYQGALVAFCNWCLKSHRLIANPLRGMPKANEKADPRRQRRAMGESELVKLLDVARRRPLADALTVRRGKRKGEAYAKLRDETREALDVRGRERALIYKTLVLTGLRKSELASLTVGKLHLDGPAAFADLDAADEKNRQGSEIMLRDDLAADLGQWLADMLERRQREANALGEPIPAWLPGDTPIFTVPAGLHRILDRDLKRAGIAKRDERGRTLDVHALRTTFGTLLSKGGVTPRTAQAAMRHSDIDLTMNVYTDPKLLDVAGALETLPALPLNGKQGASTEVAKATGTNGLHHSSLAPTLAPTLDKPSVSQSFPAKMTPKRGRGDAGDRLAVSAYSVKRKNPLTSVVNGCLKSGREDSNLRPPEPHSGALAKLRHAPSLEDFLATKIILADLRDYARDAGAGDAGRGGCAGW